jgi:hypothetical protein
VLACGVRPPAWPGRGHGRREVVQPTAVTAVAPGVATAAITGTEPARALTICILAGRRTHVDNPVTSVVLLEAGESS